MQEQLLEAWRQVQDSITVGQGTNAAKLAVYLVMGGLLSLFLRWLYHKFGRSMNSRESVTRVFPLLTLVTIGVIAVVKTSLALSLGLVGALSIVRFRAAIKEPEELVYLFLCIGVGLALGAEQPAMAMVLVGVSTLFVVMTSLSGRQRRQDSLLLTITGDAHKYFAGGERDVALVVKKNVGEFLVQRFDIEGTRGQLRVSFSGKSPSEIPQLITALQTALPDCEVSLVNLSTSI